MLHEDSVPEAASSSAGLPHASTPSRWAMTCRIATWGIGGIIALFVISQPVLWSIDTPFGESIPNMISVSMLIVGILLALLWVAVFSRWSLLKKIAVLVPALTLIGGFIASIRNVDLDGDIGLVFEYKWEQTQAERIAARQAPIMTNTPDASLVATLATAEDQPAYRGSQRDGIVIGPPIRSSWESAPKPLWQQPVGGGYASMAIVGDRLVTIEQRDDKEAVLCYQASSGREIWKYEYPAYFWEGMGGAGPRSTPTIEGGIVYAQGAMGDLICLALDTGKLLWSRNLLETFQLPNTQWGMTCSPLVIDHRVVVNAGGRRGDGLVALDRQTGKVLWAGAGLSQSAHADPAAVGPPDVTPPEDSEPGHAKIPESGQNRPGYSSPILATIHGVHQIVSFDGTGLRGYDIETGRTLWFQPHENGAAVNAAQPILFEDGRIFISCSYDVGCAMVQVDFSGDTWSVSKLWENKNMRCKFSSPILFEGYLYGLDEGYLTCLDPQTGERAWKRSREGNYKHGQLMLTNGVIVALSEYGRCHFVKPNPKSLEELGQFQALSDDYKTWNPPALVRGRLYVRNHRDMACYDLNL